MTANSRATIPMLRFKRSGAFALALCAFAACHSSAKPEVSARPAPNVKASDAPNPAERQSARSPATKDSAAAVPRVDEVTRTAVGVFGDSAVVVPLVDVDSSVADGPKWDMDVRSYENQERVAFYVNLFTQTSRSHFQERLHLGTRYEPMIRAKLRAGGIPEDMSYLALVESGFDPNAYSSAAAVGMWQFMSSTARDVGLRVDWWVDERRDPARATDAAVRFLHDLQMQFGSLYLAAAAYNGGPGRVSRGLTRFAEEMTGTEGEDRFFALAEHDYLRSETKNYVPQIIAAALVGKESVRYGFSYDTLSQYTYDSVEVAAGTPLTAVAKASESQLGTIKELNPAVLRGITPPNSSMWVRVPVNPAMQADQVATALANLGDDDKTGYRTVKSTGAETAIGLANKAGVSSKQLGWYNPGLKTTKKGKVLAGQTILIPTEYAVEGATNVPDPSIERFGSSTAADARSGSVHIVKRGESIKTIAARYHISVTKLKALNGIRGDRVVAGQALRVKAASPTARVASSNGTKRAASSAKVASASTRASSAKGSSGIKPSANASSSKTVATKKSSTAKKPASKSASSKSGSAKKPAPKKVAARKATPKRTATKKSPSATTDGQSSVPRP